MHWVGLLLLAAHAAASYLAWDQNATDPAMGTRDIPHARFWQSFTPHTTGRLASISVYVGVSESACEDISATLLVFSGIPSHALLSTFASNPSASDPSFLGRQDVTLACGSAHVVCTAWECLSWQTVTVSGSIALSSGSPYTFALVNVQSTGSARIRVGVVPTIPGSSGPSSLLVSPLFKTKYAQHAFKLQIEGSGTDPSYSGQGLQSSGAQTTEVASNSNITIIVGAVLGTVALVAIAALFVSRVRKSATLDVQATAEQLRMATPKEAWEYLHTGRRLGEAKIIRVESNDKVEGPTLNKTDFGSRPRRASVLRYELESDESDSEHPARQSTSRAAVHPGTASDSRSSVAQAWAPQTTFGPVRRLDVVSSELDDAMSADDNGDTMEPTLRKARKLPQRPSQPKPASAHRRRIAVASETSLGEDTASRRTVLVRSSNAFVREADDTNTSQSDAKSLSGSVRHQSDDTASLHSRMIVTNDDHDTDGMEYLPFSPGSHDC